MKKEKLALGKISIKSFQTNVAKQRIKGGNVPTGCCTQQIANCQSAVGSGGCGSCADGTGGSGNYSDDCDTISRNDAIFC